MLIAPKSRHSEYDVGASRVGARRWVGIRKLVEADISMSAHLM